MSNNDILLRISEFLRSENESDMLDSSVRVRIAAVLVVLQENADNNDYDFIMIKRARNILDIHSREIGFPGGMMEKSDNNNPTNTAIREAWEEIGLPKDRVEVFNVMQKFSTRTGFSIVPVFGKIDGNHEIDWKINYHEVSGVLRVALSTVTSRDSWVNHLHRGKFETRNMPAYISKFGLIWGASAIILEKIINAHNRLIL